MNKGQETRLKVISELGGKCECGKIGRDVCVYAKGKYELKWWPQNLYAKKWEEIEPRLDDYYLSCNMCRRIKLGLRTIEHGGGASGKRGCDCDPCRLQRNAYNRQKNKKMREDAKLLRQLRKEGKL
jgi:hypothetical protein